MREVKKDIEGLVAAFADRDRQGSGSLSCRFLDRNLVAIIPCSMNGEGVCLYVFFTDRTINWSDHV